LKKKNLVVFVAFVIFVGKGPPGLGELTSKETHRSREQR